MGLAPDTLNFDTTDPVRVATFWADALRFELVDPDPAGAFILDPSKRSKGVFFQPVPEPKVVKNRVHLDLRPPKTMAAEVARLREAGAREVRSVQQRDFWTIMRDPEGNEFCVQMGPDEGAERTEAGLDEVVVDSGDPRRVADFWIEALGYREAEATEDSVDIVGTRDGDPRLAFVHVPEPKSVKNRVHLDVRPSGSMAAEVARVEGLGATVLGSVQEGDLFWTVMRDPEGNEFCVLRGPEDGWSPDEP
ncbi:MAG: VOC family protein [Actinomycetota bacterium]|nr:VOC family protein [Actinomycetota bacterium]